MLHTSRTIRSAHSQSNAETIVAAAQQFESMADLSDCLDVYGTEPAPLASTSTAPESQAPAIARGDGPDRERPEDTLADPAASARAIVNAPSRDASGSSRFRANSEYPPGSPTNLDCESRRRFRWLTRPRRVGLTLAAVWVLSLFDLGFTLLESDRGHFVEMNPIAAKLLDGPAAAVIAYKVGLVGVGTIILVALRRHSVAELGCWFLFAANTYVAVRWYVYYGCTLTGDPNRFIMAPPWLY